MTLIKAIAKAVTAQADDDGSFPAGRPLIIQDIQSDREVASEFTRGYCGSFGQETPYREKAKKFRTKESAIEFAGQHNGWEVGDNCEIVPL